MLANMVLALVRNRFAQGTDLLKSQALASSVMFHTGAPEIPNVGCRHHELLKLDKKRPEPATQPGDPLPQSISPV